MPQEPILTEQQKTQLDGNIRSMLEQGVSQEDVMKYAADFKSKYGQEPAGGGSVGKFRRVLANLLRRIADKLHPL